MKPRNELYCSVLAEPTRPHCLVEGCTEPPVAVVYDADYLKAAAALNIRCKDPDRGKRMKDDPPLHACQTHMDDDRLSGVRWQFLFLWAS